MEKIQKKGFKYKLALIISYISLFLMGVVSIALVWIIIGLAIWIFKVIFIL